MQAYKNNPECDYFYGDTIFVDNLGNFIFSAPAHIPSSGLIGGFNWLGTKKEIFDKIGIFDTSYLTNSDFEFILRMYKSHIKGCYVPVTRYMQYGGISQKNWFKSYKERIRAEFQYGEKASTIYRRCFSIILRIFIRTFLEKIFGQRKILKFRKLWNKDLVIYDENVHL